MCTTVVYFTDGPERKAVFGINRDEMETRSTLPPGYHWPQLPGVFGPKDATKGGTWFAVNAQGMIAILLNRGPVADGSLRSRGEIPLLYLAEANPDAGERALRGLNLADYPGFHLIAGSADKLALFTVTDAGTLRTEPITTASLISANGRNSEACLKYRRLGADVALLNSLPEAEATAKLHQLMAVSGDRNPLDGTLVSLGNGFRTMSTSFVTLDQQGFAGFEHTVRAATKHVADGTRDSQQTPSVR